MLITIVAASIGIALPLRCCWRYRLRHRAGLHHHDHPPKAGRKRYFTDTILPGGGFDDAVAPSPSAFACCHRAGHRRRGRSEHVTQLLLPIFFNIGSVGISVRQWLAPQQLDPRAPQQRPQPALACGASWCCWFSFHHERIPAAGLQLILRHHLHHQHQRQQAPVQAAEPVHPGPCWLCSSAVRHAALCPA